MSDGMLLDASALLALLHQEKGANRVSSVLDIASMSAVNFAEVTSKLYELNIPQKDIHTILDLGIKILPFNEALVHSCGQLRPLSKKLGLPLADRVCLATALYYQVPVLTADKQWLKLDLAVDVHCIR